VISCLQYRFQLGSVARPHARTDGLPTVSNDKDKRNMAVVSVRTCCFFVSVLLIARDSVGLRWGPCEVRSASCFVWSLWNCLRKEEIIEALWHFVDMWINSNDILFGLLERTGFFNGTCNHFSLSFSCQWELQLYMLVSGHRTYFNKNNILILRWYKPHPDFARTT
jgi:hypothetical protein